MKKGRDRKKGKEKEKRGMEEEEQRAYVAKFITLGSAGQGL